MLTIILIVLTFSMPMIIILDRVFFAQKRKLQFQIKKPYFIRFAYSYWWVFLVVLIVRSFLFEIFIVPTGSLLPTVRIGDVLFVTKYNYNISSPVGHTTFLSVADPQRGDLVVFRYPLDPDVYFVKRVIGLPGDHISYIHKVLYINGKKINQTAINLFVQDSDNPYTSALYKENLMQKTHDIYRLPSMQSLDFYNYIVPNNAYFMMGDNRDNSEDSRFFGIVLQKDIVGKVQFVLVSYDAQHHKIIWNRFFHQPQ